MATEIPDVWADRQIGMCHGTELGHKSSPPLDALFIAKAQRNPFISARELKFIIFR
jgi:hypothetical protein